MTTTEPLFTREDAISEAYLLAHSKGIDIKKANYFVRMKKGRESLPISRGLEPFIEVMFMDESESSSGPSVLFAAICHELARRGLEPSVEALLKAPQS